MRNESKLKHLLMSLMVVGCSLGIESCSKDDDTKEPTGPTVEAVNGEYSGKMNVTVPVASSSETGQIGSTDISATVKNDSVYFEDFPVKGFIASIVPAEQVDVILGVVGKVQYKVGYKATMNTAKDSIYMEFSPKPLELKVPMSAESILSVKVDIAAVDKGSYSIEKKNLKFAIQASSVTVNGEILEFHSSLLSFDMNQK